MAIDTVTFDKVLKLAERLSPADQARLRAALSATADDAERAIQRQKNQAAIDLLDSWKAEAAAGIEDEDDDWWEDFMRDIDAHRMSARPLFPDRTEQP